MQVTEHPLPIDAPICLCRDCESPAQVVNRQGNRIVCSIPASEDPDPARLAPRYVRIGAAVSVIEKSAEQRRRTVHATSALRHCQGSLLMTDQLDQFPVGPLNQLFGV